MALDDFKTQELSSEDRFREYPDNEHNDFLQSLVDDLQSRFPEEVQVDFIECSPEMTRHSGMAYYKYVDGEYIRYIRISEIFVERASTRNLAMTVVHEMTHIYVHQKGYEDITERDPRFTWILGRVGASLSGVSLHDDCWEDCIEPFLE